jgi:lactate permease
MQVSWPQAVLAALPILVILALMVGMRWSARRSGSVGLAVTLLVAWFGFGFGTDVLPELGVALATGGALLEALSIAATIVWIIFPALCIHELQVRTGAADAMRSALSRLSDDPRIVALLIAWFFVLFIEGAAGFGAPVALAAPFLASAGFKRIEAVTIPLIGHTVGVSFGAVGTPVLAQLELVEYSAVELAGATSLYHAYIGWLVPLVAMLLVTRTLPKERRPGIGGWGWALLAAALFLVPHTLIATVLGPELPTLAGSLIGGGLFVVALLVMRRRDAPGSEPSGAQAAADAETEPGSADAAEPGDEPAGGAERRPSSLLQAGAPYLALVALVLLTRLVPTLRETFQDITIGWSLAAFEDDFRPLYHPGSLLFAAFLIGAAWQRPGVDDVRGAVRAAAGKVASVVVALIAMLALSRVMVYAEMVEALASAAAGTAGAAWPLFAPFVGLLGTFMTGSATASNILFTELQRSAAEQLEFATLPLLGAQGFGAAAGNSIAPHNIIAALATVGLAGKEGEVLRRTLGVALLYTLLGGLLALLAFT